MQTRLMQHLTLEVHSFFAASFMPVVAMTASSARLDEIFSLSVGSGRAREACQLSHSRWFLEGGGCSPGGRMARDRGSGWLTD